MGTQALARLAQYRGEPNDVYWTNLAGCCHHQTAELTHSSFYGPYTAGPRVFKADDAPRCGLSTGDIVVFRTRGFLLAATPVSQLGADPEAVLHVLAPSDTVDPADRVAHLEVIRQGQWLGFRSQASGDRLLQVRRRGAHRLAFFSANLGTWEQWELAEAGAVDAVPWRSVHVTLRNRRMPTCELAVEIVRVGTATLMPHTALTPRSLAVGGTEEEAPVENQNIRRMSGLMVHVSKPKNYDGDGNASGGLHLITSMAWASTVLKSRRIRIYFPKYRETYIPSCRSGSTSLSGRSGCALPWRLV